MKQNLNTTAIVHHTPLLWSVACPMHTHINPNPKPPSIHPSTDKRICYPRPATTHATAKAMRRRLR
ncbi:hypothetical protein BC567DRAFT_221073, partial [Phyllosticta citribraziliensis]